MATDAPDLSASEDAAWRSMIVIWRQGFARLDRTFRRHGLIHLEYGILAVLSEAPNATMPAGELADLSGLSTSHLSHRLKVMEQRGDIVRTASTTDRRMVSVALTSPRAGRCSSASPRSMRRTFSRSCSSSSALARSEPSPPSWPRSPDRCQAIHLPYNPRDRSSGSTFNSTLLGSADDQRRHLTPSNRGMVAHPTRRSWGIGLTAGAFPGHWVRKPRIGPLDGVFKSP